MYLKLLFLSAFIILSVSNINAQKKKKDRDFEVIEFGEEGGNKQNYREGYGNLIIKTSPTSFILGNQPFEVEKYMTDYLSLQAGIGITFAPLIGEEYNDIIAAIDEEGQRYCESDQWTQDFCDDYQDYDVRRYKPGFLISGSARLYFDNDAMDGSYFGFLLRYSTVNLEVQDVIGIGNVERIEDQWLSESIKRFDIVGHYGYQTVYDKLTAEYFLGLGARFRNESRQDVGFSASNLAQSAFRSIKETGLRVEAGLRIGFQL